MLRLYVDPAGGPALAAGSAIELPPAASRHVQVRRLQPGEPLRLFDGRGGEWRSRVAAITRSAVRVDVESFDGVDRELPRRVVLAVGMPANERMDAVVEKATELGVAMLQPLVCERSVVRLAGDRAERRRAHWQALAIAASEQCGRTRVPVVAPVGRYADFVAGTDGGADTVRWLLSPLAPAGVPSLPAAAGVVVLSGPEGGLGDDEEALAAAHGFVAVGLGTRVLRADTAPIALLARIGID